MKKIIILTFEDLPGYNAMGIDGLIKKVNYLGTEGPFRYLSGGDPVMNNVAVLIQEESKTPREIWHMFSAGMDTYFAADVIVNKIASALEHSTLIVVLAPVIAVKIAAFLKEKNAELYCIDPAAEPVPKEKNEGAFH